MMVLLLLAATPQAIDPLMSAAQSRLSVTAQAEAPVRSHYRIDGESDPGDPTAKDRAIRDDGSKCNVVGARRCAKRGRTIFRTDFTD